MVKGVNGFLIPLFDVEAMVEKMVYLVEKPEEIIRMGNSSYRISLEKFDGNVFNLRLAALILGVKGVPNC